MGKWTMTIVVNCSKSMTPASNSMPHFKQT